MQWSHCTQNVTNYKKKTTCNQHHKVYSTSYKNDTSTCNYTYTAIGGCV